MSLRQDYIVPALDMLREQEPVTVEVDDVKVWLKKVWQFWLEGKSVGQAIDRCALIYTIPDSIKDVMLEAFPSDCLEFGEHEKSFISADDDVDNDDAEPEPAPPAPPVVPVGKYLAANFYEKNFDPKDPDAKRPQCPVCFLEDLTLENFKLLPCGHYHCCECTLKLTACSLCRDC